MNKRSAMMVAAGLILALLVAGMAVAGGFTGPEAAAGRASTAKLRDREPKVRTITETVTVHRDAKPSSATAAPVVITQGVSAPASQAPGDPTSFDDDAYEHEDGGDHEDGFGSVAEDHEVEDD